MEPLRIDQYVLTHADGTANSQAMRHVAELSPPLRGNEIVEMRPVERADYDPAISAIHSQVVHHRDQKVEEERKLVSARAAKPPTPAEDERQAESIRSNTLRIVDELRRVHGVEVEITAETLAELLKRFETAEAE